MTVNASLAEGRRSPSVEMHHRQRLRKRLSLLHIQYTDLANIARLTMLGHWLPSLVQDYRAILLPQATPASQERSSVLMAMLDPLKEDL